MGKQGAAWREAHRKARVVSAVQVRLATDYPQVDIRLAGSKLFIYRKGELDPSFGFERTGDVWRHGAHRFANPHKATAWAVLMLSRDVSEDAQYAQAGH